MLPASITRRQVAEKSLQVLRARPTVPHVPYYFSYLVHHRSETTARIPDIALRYLRDAGFFHAEGSPSDTGRN